MIEIKDLHECIYKRKSTRKYSMEPLQDKDIANIEEFIKEAKCLFDDIKFSYKIVSDTKNLLPVRAPHYILIYSEEKEGALANIGFVFQQLDLYLSSMGLGSCWLGMAKPKEKEDLTDDFVIAIAFGNTPYSPHRDFEAFKRKTLHEISNGEDERIEAARLAPSATNSQNWFFEARNGMIDVFLKKLTPLEKLIYSKMSKIDIGIALAHIYIESMYLGKGFDFTTDKDKDVRKLKGLNYVGTVK